MACKLTRGRCALGNAAHQWASLRSHHGRSWLVVEYGLRPDPPRYSEEEVRLHGPPNCDAVGEGGWEACCSGHGSTKRRYRSSLQDRQMSLKEGQDGRGTMCTAVLPEPCLLDLPCQKKGGGGLFAEGHKEQGPPIDRGGRQQTMHGQMDLAAAASLLPFTARLYRDTYIAQCHGALTANTIMSSSSKFGKRASFSSGPLSDDSATDRSTGNGTPAPSATSHHGQGVRIGLFKTESAQHVFNKPAAGANAPKSTKDPFASANGNAGQPSALAGWRNVSVLVPM